MCISYSFFNEDIWKTIIYNENVKEKKKQIQKVHFIAYYFRYTIKYQKNCKTKYIFKHTQNLSVSLPFPTKPHLQI